MRNKANVRLEYCCMIFILLWMFSCHENGQENGDCSKFKDENYFEQATDTSLVRESFEFHKILLERFSENSVKDLDHESYHLQFYSSFGYGKSVKFEKRNGGRYSIAVKCKTKGDLYPDCKEYQIWIDEEEWDELEKMIYEFNFWTTEDFRGNKNVLDGYAFFLEGNRPEAKKCNKKTYKLVGRGSPQYDKMGALCENILEYESQLKFRYEQMNKIK